MSDEFTTNKKQRVGEVEIEQETTTVQPVPIQTMVMTGWVCDCRSHAPVITFKSYAAAIQPDAPDTTMETLWHVLDKGDGINKDTVSLLRTYSDLKLVIPMETGYYAKIVFVIQNVRTNDEPLAERSALPTFTIGTKWNLCYWQYSDRCETMEYVDDHVVEVVTGNLQTAENKSHYRDAFNNFRLCTRMSVALIEHVTRPMQTSTTTSILMNKRIIMVSITEVV
jgi:hypothetical protein